MHLLIELKLENIDKEGVIHSNLPEFDIKALLDSINLQHYNFYSRFSIGSDCKYRDLLTIYTHKKPTLYI